MMYVIPPITVDPYLLRFNKTYALLAPTLPIHPLLFSIAQTRSFCLQYILQALHNDAGSYEGPSGFSPI